MSNQNICCHWCGKSNCELHEQPQGPAIKEQATFSKVFIPKFRIESLKNKINILNRRAVKLGLEPIALNLTGIEALREFRTTGISEDGEQWEKFESVVAAEIEVSGLSPRLAGWAFAASVDVVTEGVNVVNKSPFFSLEIPAKYRAATQECEHCKIDRKRNNTFILHHTSGDFKQIGRSCLKDFLGHKDVHALTDAASIFDAFVSCIESEGDFSGARDKTVIAHEIEKVLIITGNLIRDFGFCSRKAASEDLTGRLCATVERLRNVLYAGNNQEAQDYAKKYSERTEEAAAASKSCIEWVREQDAAGSNEYLANLASIFTVDFTGDKHLGLVCSALTAHARHLGKLKEKAEDARKNEHFGTIGERIVLSLTIIKLIDIQSEQWGDSTLCLFEDSEGRSFKWFTSSSPFATDDTGKTFNLKATIKGHDERDGRKQTSLSRAKIETGEPKKPKARKNLAAA